MESIGCIQVVCASLGARWQPSPLSSNSLDQGFAAEKGKLSLESRIWRSNPEELYEESRTSKSMTRRP